MQVTLIQLFCYGADERGDGGSEYNQDQTVQSETPQPEAVPSLGASPLRLHVGHQPLSQRANTHLDSR